MGQGGLTEETGERTPVNTCEELPRQGEQRVAAVGPLGMEGMRTQTHP